MKKIISLGVIAVMLVSLVFCFAACGGNKTEDQVKLVNIPLTEEEYAFAMKLDNTELQASFNAYLAEIKENGKFDAIMAKYFENEGEKVGYNFVGDGTGSNETGATGEGKFVVATNCPFSPFEYVENGKIYGVDMEIAAGYAEKMGLELVIKNIDFDAILPALDAGYADIGMAGMTVTEERLESVNFSISYATGIQSIIVLEGSDIASVDDLAGHMIGVQLSTTGDIYATDEFGSDYVIQYNKGADAILALLQGKVDAVIIDNQPAINFVAANEGLVILDTEYAIEEYAACIAQDNEELLAQVNQALEELIADGTVQAILDKYIVAE